MRDSLKKSIADSPAKNFDGYSKGSVVLCNACGLPIFILDAAIAVGEGMGRAARKFKPLSVPQLMDLSVREDIDAGLKATLLAMSIDAMKAHVAKLRELRAGDPALCPCCGAGFLQVLAVEVHEVLDKAYTVEPLIVPSVGKAQAAPIRGKQLGYRKDWVH